MERDITQLVKEEAEKFDTRAKVILFGSRARGDFNNESDWDFLILLEDSKFNKTIKTNLRNSLYDLELKTNQVISTIIHSKSEWQKRSLTPLYRTIEKEGIAA